MSETERPSNQRYELCCTSFNRPPELWGTPNVQNVLNSAVDVCSFALVLWEAASRKATRFHWGSSDFGTHVFRSVSQCCCAFRRQPISTDKAIEAARGAVAVRASLAPGPWRQVLFALCIPDPTCRPKLVQDEAKMHALLQSWREQHFRWTARARTRDSHGTSDFWSGTRCSLIFRAHNFGEYCKCELYMHSKQCINSKIM